MQLLSPERHRGRVCLVVPRWMTGHGVEDRQGTPFRCFPVAGALYRNGFEVVFFDQETDWDRTDRTEELRDALRDVEVALLWTNEMWPGVQLASLTRIAQLLRGWRPRMKLVAGGTLINMLPAGLLRSDSPFDCFLRGFGEDHVVDLVEALLAGRAPDVPGATWRGPDGVEQRPIRSRPRFPTEDNDVPYRLLDLGPYVQSGGFFGNGLPTLIVGTGRGCAKRCGFCYWRNDAPAIARAEWIVDVVAHLRHRYGVRQYHLAELDFFTNRSRPLALARLWKERVPDCIWFTLCSPCDGIRFSDEEWDLLAAGGCAKIELGSESGSTRVLRSIGKTHDPEDSARLNQKLVDRGIHVLHNFIFGFPGETADDRRASVALIERLFRRSPTSVTFAPRLYQPTPETPVGSAALEGSSDFPRKLDEVGSYRSRYSDVEERAMPWLDADSEADLKLLSQHYVPLAISRLPVGNDWRGWTYRALRRLAWWRLRRHAFAFPVDVAVYRWLLRQVLTRTYRP